VTDGGALGRRGLFKAAAGAVIGLAALAGVRSVAQARPPADGTSATRCALCGSPRHAMLACPRAPRVT
jgi:hypothetical protein